MTTYPAPTVPTFPAGYGPQQADFTNWWVNNALFLQTRVVFRAAQSVSVQSIPSSGANTTLRFDNVAEDPYAGWNGSTFMWTPPAGYSGWYGVTVTPQLAAGAAGNVIETHLVGTAGGFTVASSQMSASHASGEEGTFPVYMVGGQDTIGGAVALLNATVAINTSIAAGTQSSMEIVWLRS